jgi:hypothetical protein
VIANASGIRAQSTLIYRPNGSADRASTAGQSSLSVHKYTNRQGVTSFSDRAPTDVPFRVIRLNPDCYACDLDSKVDWYSTPLHLTSFNGAIRKAPTAMVSIPP